MADPYISASPGDLIRSEDWNNMQIMIKEAVEAVTDEVVEARGEHESLSVRFDNNPGPQGEPGPQGKPGKTGDTGPAPAHEWDDTRLRFQNPDGSWGDYTDLQGESGSAGPSGVLPHLLANCLEKKTQIYIGLYRSYLATQVTGLGELLHIGDHAFDGVVDKTIADPEAFTVLVDELAGSEEDVSNGSIKALVEQGIILQARLAAYSDAIEQLQKILMELSPPITADDALKVARATNVVSIRAALLVPQQKMSELPK
jgi:hypothetical protein